jgi:hypothetical protein
MAELKTELNETKPQTRNNYWYYFSYLCAGNLYTRQNTNMEKADLRTSYNYSLDPEINRITKAKFSILGISGLLEKYNITIEK